MNHQALKEAISEDIETIKNLNPDIIPAKIYYSKLLTLFISGFWKIWLIVSITIAYAGINHPSNEGLAREAASQVMSESTLMAFFLSFGAMLLLSPSINFFILFRFHLESKLKTGALLVRKFKHITYLFFGFFILLCALFGSYGESAAIFMIVVFSFFGSLAATYFFVKMELNRIGISTIFTIFDIYFNKGNKLSIE
ncbi:hypothetical protein [Legionella gresilensis]|uniref:hypothetical protein n=1 Tax=Legionella gresilensis TaxID=91823 RepID=UPI0010410654|nr:hypothetical protein [Legionella gresilensis]